MTKPSLGRILKTLVIGEARSPSDRHIFHKLSLVAFFAWIGLGADGLSSSCYGPPEAFLALGQHYHLGIFVAIGTALTVFIISESYSQIIELFPSGGGGYLVASKLLSPNVGMVSGCALLIDYVLTISISIASGADAIFSMLPPSYHQYKLTAAALGVVLLLVMNLRGVRESVMPLVPIFLIFIISHVFAIVYAIVVNVPNYSATVASTVSDIHSAGGELGILATVMLVMRAYSMGAGTYTGIEAVSNGLPILREPRVRTAKRTMMYMATSLAFMATGLMVAYILYNLHQAQIDQPTKTLNAILFEHVVQGWGRGGKVLVWLALISEGAILLVAAQTGFLDGPRVLSNMALDRWFPGRFAVLSDRLVTQNGIVLMGLAAILVVIFTGGSVGMLVVLYSINVFITFALSQLGMVRHWWLVRQSEPKWGRRLFINGIGLVLTVSILTFVASLKFREGGWVTLVITGSLIAVAVMTRRHYRSVGKQLRRLDDLVTVAESSAPMLPDGSPDPKYNRHARTAVLLVSGFNGLGLHTMFTVIRQFGECFRGFVFLHVGLVDAGNFKGVEEVEHLRQRTEAELDKYVEFCRRNGYYAERYFSLGVDLVSEVNNVAPQILDRFPQATFFGGQLVFREESIWTRLLHNYAVFAIQRKFYHQGIPFVILPIRV